MISSDSISILGYSCRSLPGSFDEWCLIPKNHKSIGSRTELRNLLVTRLQSYRILGIEYPHRGIWMPPHKNIILVEMACLATSILQNQSLPLTEQKLDKILVYLAYVTSSDLDFNTSCLHSSTLFDEACKDLITAWTSEPSDKLFYSTPIKENASIFFRSKEKSKLTKEDTSKKLSSINPEATSMPQNTPTTKDSINSQDSNLDETSQNRWAPIVYGRTYNEDYRILAMPADSNENEIWIKSFLVASCRYPEKLRNSERWLLVKTKKFCIVGVSCKADYISKDNILDSSNRPITVFLGYISQHPFPQIPNRDINNFKDLYKIIKDRWESQIKSDRFVSEYKEMDFSYPDLNTTSIDQYLNFNEEQVNIWKDNETRRQLLWVAASKTRKPTSLCLGLAQRKDIERGPFINATLAGSTAITKEPETIFITNPSDDSEDSESYDNTEYSNSPNYSDEQGNFFTRGLKALLFGEEER